MENFVSSDLENVQIKVLKGRIELEVESSGERRILDVGENASIPNSLFHQIYTVSSTPSCYMYSFRNRDKTASANIVAAATSAESSTLSQSFFLKEQIFSELKTLGYVIRRSIQLIVTAVSNIINNFVPIFTLAHHR